MANVFLEFGLSFGMLSKFYPIIQRLVVSGHNVKYVSLYPYAEKYLNPLGVQPLSSSFTLSDRPSIPHRRNFCSTEEHSGYHWFADMDWAFQKINDMAQLMDDFKPDITVESWGIFTNIISKISKYKCISITHGCYHPERKYEKLRWWDHDTEEVSSNLLNFINEMFTQNGTPMIGKFEELYTGDYTLIPNIPELDPLTNENRFNTHYIAPMIWDSNNRLDKSILNFNPEWPTIFCYTGKLKDGSSTKDNELLHLLLGSLLDNELNIILTVGKQSEIEIAKSEYKKYQPSVANVAIAADVSISDALNISDIIIHHGGYGSCISQLVYGKPSVIIPTHSEREYNARMCENLGLGICVPFENATPVVLRKSVLDVLENESYQSCAIKYYNLLKERKYCTAEDVIEKVLNTL